MKMFLDDVRMPVNTEHWVIIRTCKAAIQYCMDIGCPDFISFDHDLGPNIRTGYDFAHWLIERDMDMDGFFIPTIFGFDTYSMNPVGKENIDKLLTNYFNQRDTSWINNSFGEYLSND